MDVRSVSRDPTGRDFELAKSLFSESDDTWRTGITTYHSIASGRRDIFKKPLGAQNTHGLFIAGECNDNFPRP
jgi:hypothetical protein